MNLTTDQIVAMAPDDASLKAARSLTSPAKWPLLGQSSDALWGECQGSGSKPYQVSVDLTSPGSKCTCPSRKFPCKHALGLLLIAAEKPASVHQSDPPPWVTDWLTSRRQKSEKKVAAASQNRETADPEAAAKRTAKRLARMKEGGEELARWLADQVRGGIADYPRKPSSFFTAIAARMVDAQTPGLGNEISRLESMIHTGDGWPRHVLGQLGRIYLLIEALRRFESLRVPLQADLRAELGWPLDREEVLATQPLVQDNWTVLGQTYAERDKLWERRTWLWGQTTRKMALLLEFAYGNRSFAITLAVGMRIKASLAYFPSVFPLRALLADEAIGASPLSEPFPAYPDFDSCLNAFADALSGNPWLRTLPVALDGVTPLLRDEFWLLRDLTGTELRLQQGDLEKWQLLAESSGRPVRVFGEFNGRELRVLSSWEQGSPAFVATS